MELISIITPARNAGKAILEAAESVLAQSYVDWEWIVVDNGSTDGSIEALKTAFSDQRIKFLSEQEKGVSKARNKGMMHMSGTFLCFLDADDRLPEHSLSSRLEVLKTDSLVSFCDGAVDYWDETFTKRTKRWTPLFRGEPLYELCSLSGSCFFGNTWMIRVDASHEYQMNEDLNYCEDLEFYIRLSGQGLYSYTSETVLHYRQGHQSAMANLRGLETGYYTLSRLIERNSRISRDASLELTNRSRFIMIKSYFKALKFGSGLRVILSGLRP
jgi:teichuronic acid biosynthesis glycosyltransferase TuaG